jgi:hypothetical protein
MSTSRPPDSAQSTDGLPQFEQFYELDPAVNTHQNYAYGKSLFNEFAALSGVKRFEDFTKTDFVTDDGELVKSAFRRFATFLRQHILASGLHYKPDTQTQCLSNAKNALAKKHSSVTMLRTKHPDCEWYSELLGHLRIRGRAEAVKRGETIKDSTVGIRGKLLARISDRLFKDGTQLSLCERAIVLTLYHAVGRGSEVSTCNFDLFRWDEDEECLWTAWQQVKTGRGTDLSFHPDATSYVTCEINALACYIVTAGNSLVNKESGAPDWLFPGLSDLSEKGGASSKATRILKKLIGRVDGLRSEHTSHGLRAGPADEMAFNHLVHTVCMIARGDWDWKGECQLFGYLTNAVHVATAGKSLSNWADPRQKVSSPSLDPIITVENKAEVEKFCYCLFLFAPKHLQPPSGSLLGFRNTMVAALLKDFDDMVADGGFSNNIIVVMMSAAGQCNISRAVIREWGCIVRKDFQLRNARNQKSTRGNDVDRAHAAIGTLVKTVQTQQEEIVQVQRMVAAQAVQMTRMENMLSTLVDSASVSPRKKIRRLEESPTSVAVTGNATVGVNVAGGDFGSSPPRPLLLNAMLKDRARPVFLDLLKTDVGELMMKISIGALNTRDPTCFGKDVKPSQKGRAVQVYIKALQYAEPSEKLILRKVKRPDDNDYQDWSNQVKTICEALPEKLWLGLKSDFELRGLTLKIKPNAVSVSAVANALASLAKADK